MKHSICGFHHEVLANKYRCDYDDAQILRTLLDFYLTGKMETIKVSEEKSTKEYFWVCYSWLLRELFGLRCRTKRGLAKRMKRFIDNGLMQKHVMNHFQTYYRFTEAALDSLIFSPKERSKLGLSLVPKSTTPAPKSATPPVTPVAFPLVTQVASNQSLREEQSSRVEPEEKEVCDSGSFLEEQKTSAILPFLQKNTGKSEEGKLPWFSSERGNLSDCEYKEHLKLQVLVILATFPKKIVDTDSVIEAIEGALKKVSCEKLYKFVQAYADEVSEKDSRYIANPVRWFNEERWREVEDLELEFLSLPVEEQLKNAKLAFL
jgi:hypothetical protein